MGPYLSVPIKDKHTTNGKSKDGKFVWAASEMQGWRNSMEDAHITQTDIDEHNTCIFGVFDGHGGQQVARFVERHYVQQFLKNASYQRGDIQSALQETFLQMDVMIDSPEGKKELSEIKNGTDRGGDTEFQCFAGCTANVAVIYKGQLYVGNAGDSRTILSVSGKQYPMSEDHKPDNPLEQKRITDGGGFIAQGRVNGNLNLSRAMGDMEYKHDKSRDPQEQLIIAFPDVKAYQLTPEVDFILMGCDGIWECLTNQELVNFIAQNKSNGISESQNVENLLDAIIAPDTHSKTEPKKKQKQRKMLYQHTFDQAKIQHVYTEPQQQQAFKQEGKQQNRGDIVLKNITEQVYNSAIGVFLYQFTCAIISALVLVVIIIFIFWFEPLGFWISGVLVFGVLVNTLLAYLTIRHAVTNSVGCFVATGDGDNPQELAFKYGWTAASTLTIGVFSIYLLVFFVFFLIFKRLYLAEDHSIDELTGWTVIMISFALGVALSSIYYRETGSQVGKGIIIGADIVGGFSSRNDKGSLIYQNLQSGTILGSIFTNTMSSMMDFLTIFSLMLTASMTIVGHSEKLNKQNYSGMYIPLFILSLSILSSMFLNCFSGESHTQEDSAKTYAGLNQRYQIYYVLMCNAVLYFSIPLMLLPTWFDIGAEELWAEQGISKWHVYGILIIGILLQFLLVLLTEFLTSMDKAPTKAIAINLERNVSFAVFSSSMQTSMTIAAFVILILIAFFFVFLMAGFFGIGILAITLIGSPMLFIGLTIAANAYADAYKYSILTGAWNRVTDTMRQLSNAGSIFSVFSHMLNGVSSFLVNFMAIGALLIISKSAGVNIWGAYGLFGFFYGILLALFLKGSASLAIKRCSEQTFVDENDSKGNKGSLDRLSYFLNNRLQSVTEKVILNTVLCLGSVLLIGTLLGSESLITFLIGLNFMGFYLILTAVIQGNSERNAKIYYDRNKGYDEALDDSREMSRQKELDMVATAVNLAPASHLIVLITFTTLVAVVTALIISEWGFLRKLIDEIMEEHAGLDKPDDADSGGSGGSKFWTPIGEWLDNAIEAIGDFFKDIFNTGDVK